MRIDHHAYQRATKVALLGLALQAAIGLLLLIFGLTANDTAFQFASVVVVIGVLVWLGLAIVFHQHRLERLEALEEDELAASRGISTSVFDRTADESRVAARRLALMYKWVMPGISLLIVLLLAAGAWWLLRYMQAVNAEQLTFHRTDQRGWAIAICLGAAVIAFIFSRFTAGMAKQHAWQNLRGGAAYMVGNALVMLGLAVGLIVRFLERDQPSKVIEYVAWAIPIFMLALAAEITLNFILNMYRPRVPGEIPRPPFDSKALSLLAAPDSIVRSLNEAINYQFGFDVTSSWGYQLLLRSVASLVVLGAATLVVLSTMVVVEPHQQAIRLRFGKIVGDRVYDSGLLLKWPWPIESAIVYDVSRIRNLHLTAEVTSEGRRSGVSQWDENEPPRTNVEIEPFIVGASSLRVDDELDAELVAEIEERAEAQVERQLGSALLADRDVAAVSAAYSLVDAEIVLRYRIRQDNNGLLNYLQFAPETHGRRQTLTDRQRALRALALKQVSAHLSRLSLDQVLSPGQTRLGANLRDAVQAAFDAHKTGIEVVAIDVPMLRPSGSSAPSFEELGISAQARYERLAVADRNAANTFTDLLGDASLADEVIAAIDEYDRLRLEFGHHSPEAIEQRQVVEQLLMQGGGTLAQVINDAERDRWTTLMAQRARASMVASQLPSYLAAPNLYRQRELMRIYKQHLPVMKKYIIAIDPSRLNVDADLKDLSPAFEFAGASEEEMQQQ